MDEIAAALDRRLRKVSPAPLIVAFSGGGDSLALLLAAKAWADAAGRSLIAATVDHRLQAASARWAEWCGRRAARLGVGHLTLVWREARPTTGIAARARRARHRLLAEAARENGAGVVLMGHTRDDILEARMMRAAGGAAGEPREWSPSPVWPEGRGIFLVRPLLSLRRQGLRDHLRTRGETWIDDPGNVDLASARARVRAQLRSVDREPPADRREEGPDSARETGRQLFGRASVQLAGDIQLNLTGLARSERQFLLGAALVCAGGGEKPPRRAALERLLALAENNEPGVATLAGARVRYGQCGVYLAREDGALARREPIERPLPLGASTVWDGRFAIHARAPGLGVRPLGGLIARLERPAREALRLIPAVARGALPAIVGPDGLVCVPTFDGGQSGRVECLVEQRLAAALGASGNEADADAWRSAVGHTKLTGLKKCGSVQ